MENRSPAVALAARQPPSSLSGFTTVLIAPESPSAATIAVDFAIRCKACDGVEFAVSGFPKMVPDPSPYYDVAPGQILWQPPHRFECLNCRNAARIFDPATDGYDGVLNGGCACERGDDGEAFAPGRFTVVVSVLYNIELEELVTLAADAQVRPSDLFDAIDMQCTPVDGGPVFALSYECA